MKKHDLIELIEKTVDALPANQKTFKAGKIAEQIDICPDCVDEFLKENNYCCLGCAIVQIIDELYKPKKEQE